MKFLRKKLNYYYNGDISTEEKVSESSYVFDILSEEDKNITKKKVVFDEIIKKNEEYKYDHKYILSLLVTVLILIVKILYGKLIYK